MVENQTKSYWGDSLGVFGRMSAWIAGPIIIGLFLGKWLDDRLGTTPMMFVVAMMLSFACSIFGIVREAKKYMKNIEKDIESKKQETKQHESNSNDN